MALNKILEIDIQIRTMIPDRFESSKESLFTVVSFLNMTDLNHLSNTLIFKRKTVLRSAFKLSLNDIHQLIIN